jgi:hypothetical protein
MLLLGLIIMLKLQHRMILTRIQIEQSTTTAEEDQMKTETAAP